MAIRFVEKPPGEPRRKPQMAEQAQEDAQSSGEARFATPIEAVKPVNPDASGELPFSDLPHAETAARKKRPPRAPRK